ncbi:hypothetical protein ACPDHL_13335 [Myroides sp. C15-4]|uniref:hypothetical protein n=1 Tax=Myroides sp. C15-4 TaxID=3400532 RepID=UPI003D2F6151
MKTTSSILFLFLCFQFSFSQKLLTSWSQQNIENYTKEMYDEAQNLSSAELVEKNVNDEYWSEVFLTLNASLNHHAKDIDFLHALTEQITDKTQTNLKGSSRLIIWDRISSGDLTFEGKGIVFENDLFTVAGRANQLLQSLTNKNFGFITIETSQEELESIKNKWQAHLAGKPVDEFQPVKFQNSKIPEISSLAAIKALVISLQENPIKNQLTKKCLHDLYNLEELPKEKGSSASYCNPDTYTYAYLGMVFGHKKADDDKNATWWLNFWNENQNKLIWNSSAGIYEIKK